MADITGTRRDVTDSAELAPGEYGKSSDDTWYCCVPFAGLPIVPLSITHTVIEHEDGSITVDPSILSSAGKGKVWHGRLEHGVWKEL